MGAGAALIMPATLSLLISVFTDARERATAIGIWAATAGLGVALGPVVGGVLLDHFWWGSIFIVNVPLTAAAVLAGRRLLPESRDPVARRIDWPGAALSGAGLVAFVWAIIEAPRRPGARGVRARDVAGLDRRRPRGRARRLHRLAPPARARSRAAG
jgi:DHA2 family multidrug resistance protein-like MFS transporter